MNPATQSLRLPLDRAAFCFNDETPNELLETCSAVVSSRATDKRARQFIPGRVAAAFKFAVDLVAPVIGPDCATDQTRWLNRSAQQLRREIRPQDALVRL